MCMLTVWVAGELHLSETVVELFQYMCVCVLVKTQVDESTYVGVCLGIPGLMKLELVCMCVCA